MVIISIKKVKQRENVSYNHSALRYCCEESIEELLKNLFVEYFWISVVFFFKKSPVSLKGHSIFLQVSRILANI